LCGREPQNVTENQDWFQKYGFYAKMQLQSIIFYLFLLPSIFALVFLPGILCKALGVEQLGLSVCPLVPRPDVQERQIEEIPENIGKIFVKFYF